MVDDKDFDWLDDDPEIEDTTDSEFEEVEEDEITDDENDIYLDMESDLDDNEDTGDSISDYDPSVPILEDEVIEVDLEEDDLSPTMHTHLEESNNEHSEMYMSTVIQVLQPVSQTSMDHIYRQLRSTRGTLYAVGEVELIDLTDTDVANLNEGMI